MFELRPSSRAVTTSAANPAAAPARRVGRFLVALALVACGFRAASVRAQSAPGDSIPYALGGANSSFAWGCFGACACPVLWRKPLEGTFLLRRSHIDPLFTTYDVLDVRWRVNDGLEPVVITGSGTYRRGGEFALVEQMTLDLSINGEPARRFDSGPHQPSAPFPEISLELSLNGEAACFDTVLAVDAKPAPATTGLDDGRARPLALVPNPTRTGTEIAFTLAKSQSVELAIFDPAGRRLRTLIAGEALPPGPHARRWDGRLEGGAEAPAGIYLVKLTGAGDAVTSRLAKLR